MNYIKNMLSRYAGFQLFFLNVSYLMLLVLILTPGEITQSILTSSLYLLVFISAISIYILRASKIDFNIPNSITNFRLVLNIFIFVCIYNAESYNIETILLLVIISLILDGADGYLSRHLNQMTLFGKTFDQEVDNFLIFILSFSLIYNYDFNIALVCIPLYRYIFLILINQGFIGNHELPESLFRKTVCVITILSLAACNYYNMVESMRSLIYIIIILVSYSFLKDTIYLYRRKNA
jgi:phosphatidylglycerophosphate synthase